MSAENLLELASRLEPLISTFNPPPVYWIGNGGEGLDYCFACCKALVDDHNKKRSATDAKWVVDGGWDAQRENDGPASCDACSKTLGYTLTQCGVAQEIDHFQQHPPTSPLDPDTAYAIGAILDEAAYSDCAEVVDAAMKIGAAAIAALPEELISDDSLDCDTAAS